MSELQDKLDRGEITLEGYHASWITQNGRKPAARPRRHDQLYEYLIAKYPDPSVEADAFFALENRTEYPPKSQQRDRPQIRRPDELIASKSVR